MIGLFLGILGLFIIGLVYGHILFGGRSINNGVINHRYFRLALDLERRIVVVVVGIGEYLLARLIVAGLS